MFTLAELPYSEDALSPHISQQTISFHYHKHHQGYVDKLNQALLKADATMQAMTLEQLISHSDGSIYNLAAQVWNHTFYWQSMCPSNNSKPSEALAKILTESFGSVDSFIEQFTATATQQFGSGWAWLVKNKDGSLAITSTSDAVNPLSNGQQPLITLDVWEHAYYLDYQNKRPDYVANFFAHLINWDFIEENLNA
ncbi:superoxide dismutase [Dasania marina]|uniref:superoxide dismutase n=1 Tax=Dasania marina TaxID=471499 RepID=UPI0030DD3F25|tara:strand:- start:5997 stop:6584 length:588 start_codon:yes stop_codon:yes gene_type:complete